MFPLGLRSFYSLMQGTSSPAQLCTRARKLGYSGLALTDRDSLIGLFPFLTACKRARLRPLIGAELTAPDSDQSVICLVKNNTGYRNLCHLISARRQHTTNSRAPFSLLREIPARAEGLLVLARCPKLLHSLFKNDVELAVNLGDHPTGAGSRMRRWAQRVQVPAVAVPMAAMAEKNELPLLRLLQAIGSNGRLSPSRSGATSRGYLESAAVYRARFAIWPEVITATEELAARCDFTGPDFGTVMPPWRVEGSRATPFLRRAAYRGARKRYGTPLDRSVISRLEHELQIIDSMGFSSYFLVVRDIVDQAARRSQDRSPRICGRGSGAASLVAYCLGITNVCPLQYNLYFERFLNPGRTDPPDIDIDFAWDERDKVLAQVLGSYGGHAAMVSTTICFQPRMAIRETAKAFGLPPGEISAVTKRIPFFRSRNQASLLSWMQKLPALRGHSLAKPWPTIINLAAQLVGIPRHLSVHPGGVVITPKPIRDYVPVERAAKGVPLIQWDKDATEEAGLVKIDLLGNRSLGVIRDCLLAVRDGGGEINEERWQPEKDPATKHTVATGGTMGCFYIESPAMRLLQQKAGSGDFEQLVLMSSLIRPAANDYIREYVRRLHGGSWHHLHPRLQGVLDETFGIMVYQEDVSRVAVAMAGFSHARADGLRKVISKKDRELRLQDYRREFDSGCAARGVDGETRKKLWQMMMSFDGYSFCKPHSASYARVSFQAAYLKTHYPAEFMAAVISNQGGYYSTFAYVSEAKRLGLRILPPCVNRSGRRWQGRGRQIRVGLMAIKGISEGLMQRIIKGRLQGKFTSALDFFQRTQPASDECRALIHAGALDSLDNDRNRTRLLWNLARFTSLTTSRNRMPLLSSCLPPAPKLPPTNPRELLRREYRVLGFLCTTHPLALCAHKLPPRIQAQDIARYRGRQVTLAGWLITGKLVSTKTGEVMEFLTFEDETALVETTFFPAIYRRYAAMLTTGRPYILQGVVEEEYGAHTLTVHRLHQV